MKPETQRIAIAEACGWECPDCKGAGGWTIESTPEDYWHPCFCKRPDYLSDLNAMHEAEKTLIEREPNPSSRPQDHPPLLYYMTLLEVVSGKKVAFSPFDYFRMTTATAAQRAEAFLRTLGKWNE